MASAERCRVRTALAVVRALRPHQWIKNLLVFVPVLVGHRVVDVSCLLHGLAALASLSLCASGVYVINDLLDLEADRRHAEKRKRPFASGALPIAMGPVLAFLLLSGSLAVATTALSLQFAGCLFAYVAATCLYSAWFKKVVLLDVFILASLYTFRIVAGGVATSIQVSEWLMAFSMFFFLSLAFVKRYAELVRMESEGAVATSRRGYLVKDAGFLESIGCTSGYLAVLVFALYIHSPEMKLLYKNGWVLWLICPVLLYWITYVWLKAKRCELTEDPVLFAFRDRVSISLGALTVLLAALAQW